MGTNSFLFFRTFGSVTGFRVVAKCNFFCDTTENSGETSTKSLMMTPVPGTIFSNGRTFLESTTRLCFLKMMSKSSKAPSTQQMSTVVSDAVLASVCFYFATLTFSHNPLGASAILMLGSAASAGVARFVK